MKPIHRILTVVAAAVFVTGMAAAQSNPCNPCGKSGQKFVVDDPMERNTITFESTAPLEDIVGTSNDITGYLVFDPKNPKMGGHGELSVPVKSFNTGIPLRDEHLVSSDWFHADKYPDITFRIKEVKSVTETKSTDLATTWDVTVVGELSMHGQTKQMSFPGRITYMEESSVTRQKMAGDLLAARATFEFALDDFKITGPSGKGLIGTKVGEKITVDISVMGSSAAGEMAGNPCGDKQAGNPCNPCAKKAAGNPCNPCGKKPMNPCNPCGK